MKKRIVCVLLTLIMLVSLVPATVITASAATRNISEAAITVLKQAEGYSTTCNSKGYTGYGTLCTEKGSHGAHKTTEKEADVALREALVALDEAVNSFASRNGLALSQNKHDALVLFSFENGTAWTTGTGALQAAIKSGKTGNEFLNAICWWDNSIGDDYRRMIEANMYLNGAYSSVAPSRFVRVKFDVNSSTATMSEAVHQYFDVASAQPITIVPTNGKDVFLGWYTYKTKGKQVTTVTADTFTEKLRDANGENTLFAHWQGNKADPGADNAYYKISASKLASRVIYKEPNGKKANLPNATGTIRIDSEFLDKDGTRWGRMVEERTDPNNTADMYTEFVGWVKIEVGASSNTSASTGATMDVTVTVTNAYVNMRNSASITSTKVGSWTQGAQLRIINKVNGNDGFVWGQVAKSATDSTPVGWVALMYTNYDAAASENVSSGSTASVVGTATITYNGYVNVRNAAGTDNQIVGALPNGTTVELYETKYVNGIQWGRCKTGWFCLAYADVDTLVESDDVADIGFTTYAFKGTLLDPMNVKVYKQPSTNAEKVKIKDEDRKKLSTVTITNLTAVGNNTWGKFAKGWVIVTDQNGDPVDVDLNTAKFTVIAETVNVRSNPSTDAAREDILVKGVEFNVNVEKQVRVVGETIWGFANKVGEKNKNYNGWINLANKNVSRDGSALADNVPTASGKVATVIGTDTVKVRATGATYGTILGSLNRGATAAVLAEKDGWYNLDVDVDGNPKTGSWVYGKYLQISEGSVSGTSGSTTGANGVVSTGMGIVANTYAGVNVRTGAGTAYAAVGKLLPGTSVEIKEVKTVGASKWGRTAQGWVCMDYITMISNYEVSTDTTGSTAGGNAAGGTTTSEVAIYSGTVNTDTTVYKTTSKDSDPVRKLSAGDPITMHEIVTHVEYDDKSLSHDNEGETIEMKTTYWARVNDGYIYSPGDCIDLDTIDEQTYTVTGADTLNVREGAGTSYAKKDFKLAKGDQVAITQLKIDKGSVWGFFERDDNTDGWISLAYTTKGAVNVSNNDVNQNNTQNNTVVTPPVIGSTGNTTTGGFVNNTAGYKYTGKVINANEVNVRATASTAAAKTTTLKNGAALVIYETTISEGMAWGRCDAGWVYLYYVDLTPVNGAVDARVVYNENTIIYSDMNCTSTTGSTYAKMSVIDIYEIVGKMARTNDGWVNTDNLL